MTNVKPYFEKELVDTVNKIKHYKKDGCFAFSIFADIHTHPSIAAAGERQTKLLECMRALFERVSVEGVFFLGDAVFTNYQEDYPPNFWTNERMEQALTTLHEGMRTVSENAFMVSGNHDGLHAGEPNEAQFYRLCVAPMEGVTSCQVRTVKEKAYYYVDYLQKKVRCICLESCYQNESGRYYHYAADQMRWLAEEALQVPAGTNIVLLAHIEPYSNERPERYENFRRLMSCYSRRQVYQDEELTADFTQAKGQLIAMLAGHEHYDYVSDENFACPYVDIGCASGHTPWQKDPRWHMHKGAIAPTREAGTFAELLWDTVIFDPNDRDIVLVRFGAGGDRYIKL